MSRSILDAESYRRALSVRDLTDPAAGPHALQLLVDAALRALRDAWRCDVEVYRESPIVSTLDNYDKLHYPEDGAARDARYTRYVTETSLLRTQTSAMIPKVLRALATRPPADMLIACPGIVYRRDVLDRLHTGEPHQIDLWRVRSDPQLSVADLHEMIGRVIEALLPGVEARRSEAVHPYTVSGIQIDVRARGEWIEIGECGLALPALLAEAGLDPKETSGLAMGLGLDRILMLRKGIDDIRLLRAEDPRIAQQMLDLKPYQPVSDKPAIRRDLSIAVAEEATPEELGDQVRTALGDRARCIEAVEILSETPYSSLPDVAIQRLGIAPGQKNALLRVVIRDLERTLTHAEANALRDDIYAALHRGAVHHWASGRAPG